MSTAAPAVETRSLRFRRPRLPVALRQPLGIVGAVILAVWILLAILAPLVAPANPLAQRFAMLQPPGGAHLFGTDELGRDVLSRVIYGARVTIPLGLLLIALAVAVGSALGAIAGYFGGWVDEIVMRATDLVFAFPTIILAMAMVAALGPGLFHAVLALVIVYWPAYARIARGLVRSAMTAEYVTARRLLGASALTALFVDILPNVAGPVLVYATLDLGNAILLLSGLSFLGLGAQPPTAEWGLMVSEGENYFNNWWIATFAGLSILSVVLACNFMGDSLRDVLDPQAASQHEVRG